MEFRPRNYKAEEESHALPRSRADHHPLSTPSHSPSPPLHNQVDVVESKDDDFFDPLRGPYGNAAQAAAETASEATTSGSSSRASSKEWISFKRILMQKFPVSKMISISSTSDVIVKGGKTFEKSSKSTHLEELDDPQKLFAEDAKVITWQEYVSRLHELKDDITRAWHTEDRAAALKLCIKVAKLLMDTSVLQFYPTLFVLVTDVMDMLGDMVWERIKKKAEFAEDGRLLCSLSENFKARDICFDAKETCNNWFCKVGSIRELLPRIYLELAILPCWRFLLDGHGDILQRLVMMTRGLADPLASAYCRLYIAHCARKLPTSDTGYLFTCVNDMKILLVELASDLRTADKERFLISLMEPTVEYIVKCIVEAASQGQVDAVLVELGLRRNQSALRGNLPCASIVLHHLLKELPTDVVNSNAVDVLHLIKCSNDYSFGQCLNYRLLGFRLLESGSQIEIIKTIVDAIIQVVAQYDRLDEYLKVVDAYVDIVLQNEMDSCLNTILHGLSERALDREIAEDELGFLQSILMKLLSHFNDLDDVFALNHFLEVLDVMSGSSRSVIDVHILNRATRNGKIRDPKSIQLLFEISQSLLNGLDVVNMKDDDNQQPTHLISRFIHMVDYGSDMERHLTFLVECRGAFGSIDEIKETLVRTCNCLAAKALKDRKQLNTFIKSCIAFSEVTIPSISVQVKQLNLYLEAAEVALFDGLISHTEGLIFSAISCIESVDFSGGLQKPLEVDGILSSIKKLCSLLVIVPGNPNQGVTKFPKAVLSLVYSQSWMSSRMKTRIFCAVVLLLATLSQNKLPYHAYYSEILGNDSIFFGDSSYAHELISLSECVIQNLVNSVEQEPSKAARGSIALEACNCIASSFKASPDVFQVCWKLIDTARLCLSANDKYLQSTIKYLDEQLPARMVQSVAI